MRPVGAFVVAMLLAGIVSVSAGAHVTVRAATPKPRPGEPTLFTLVVRNDLVGGRVIREVQVDLPRELAVTRVPARAGWQGRVAGRRVTWVGGAIAPQAFELLSVRGIVRGDPPRLVFRPTFRLEDGTLFGTLEEQPVASLSLRSASGSDGWPLGAVAIVAVLAAGALVALLLGLRRGLPSKRRADPAG